MSRCGKSNRLVLAARPHVGAKTTWLNLHHLSGSVGCVLIHSLLHCVQETRGDRCDQLDPAETLMNSLMTNACSSFQRSVALRGINISLYEPPMFVSSLIWIAAAGLCASG